MQRAKTDPAVHDHALEEGSESEGLEEESLADCVSEKEEIASQVYEKWPAQLFVSGTICHSGGG